MPARTKTARTIRSALLAGAIGLSLIVAPAFCGDMPGAGSAYAFDFGKLGSSFKTKKKKPANGAFGNVSIRFSIFSDASPPRKKYKAKRARPAGSADAIQADEKTPAVGMVTAYEKAKIDALVSGDPQAIEAANEMLHAMFKKQLDSETIASFDKLLGIAVPIPQLASGAGAQEEPVGSL